VDDSLFFSKWAASSARGGRRRLLENLYGRLNLRRFVHPDPLEVLYDYADPADREIVGIIASSLAYGRVAQILASVRQVLNPMGASPSDFLRDHTPSALKKRFHAFKHRFTTGEELAALLSGVRKTVRDYGSLEACFIEGLSCEKGATLPAMDRFVRSIGPELHSGASMFLPAPSRGSACKRLNLFLRWMVRRDDVDPGGWRGIPCDRLIVPLDTHMLRIARRLGLTGRTNADLKTAVEVTESFRHLAPDDPVRYDFTLTRLGIWSSVQLPHDGKEQVRRAL
jgi:uncharacterized protein (TIGR02757 family)